MTWELISDGRLIPESLLMFCVRCFDLLILGVGGGKPVTCYKLQNALKRCAFWLSTVSTNAKTRLVSHRTRSHLALSPASLIVLRRLAEIALPSFSFTSGALYDSARVHFQDL